MTFSSPDDLHAWTGCPLLSTTKIAARANGNRHDMRINVSELCQGMGVIQDGGGSSFSGAPQFGQSLALCPCQIAWCARDN